MGHIYVAIRRILVKGEKSISVTETPLFATNDPDKGFERLEEIKARAETEDDYMVSYSFQFVEVIGGD